MVRNVVVTIIVICQLFAVAACAQKVVAEPASKPQVQAENTDTFVYGRVSLEPTEKIEQYQPVVDYLAVRLGEHGIGVGQVKVAPDAETMALWLANGEVDLFNDSFFVTEYVSNHSGAVPIVYREKESRTNTLSLSPLWTVDLTRWLIWPATYWPSRSLTPHPALCCPSPTS